MLDIVRLRAQRPDGQGVRLDAGGQQRAVGGRRGRFAQLGLHDRLDGRGGGGARESLARLANLAGLSSRLLGGRPGFPAPEGTGGGSLCHT